MAKQQPIINYKSDRSSILDDLKVFASQNKYWFLQNCISVMPVEGDGFSKEEIIQINSSIEKDINSFIDHGLRTIPDTCPGSAYYRKMKDEMNQKMKLIFNLNLENNIDRSDISKNIRYNPEDRYGLILHYINLDTINKQPIHNRFDYAVCTVLACIYWLFIRDVYSSNEGTKSREEECANAFKQFNEQFHFKSRIEEENRLFFNIKNSIAHGFVTIDEKMIKIKNEHPVGTVLFEGIGHKKRFIQNYLTCSKTIETMVTGNKDDYIQAHELIKDAVDGELPILEGPSMLLFATQFVSTYGRKYERVSSLIEKCSKADIKTFNSLFEFDLEEKVTIIELRNAFSHSFSLDKGMIKITTGKGSIHVSMWEMIACIDIISMISDIILLELELHSSKL